jgi:hypothetical protein
MMNVEDDSMKNMVRMCRLTLAPIPALGNDVQITKDAEILDKEKMARGMEITMLTTSTSSHRILGVEDRLSYRFWARDGEEDSDEDSEGGQEQDEDDSSMQTLNSPEFCRVAMEVGFTESELLQAEEEVKISPNSKKYVALEGSLASRVIKDIISNKKVKPWSGPLPPPRISPRRTIGDAIAMAQVRTNPQNRQFISDSFKQRNKPSFSRSLSSAMSMGSHQSNHVRLSLSHAPSTTVGKEADHGSEKRITVGFGVSKFDYEFKSKWAN